LRALFVGAALQRRDCLRDIPDGGREIFNDLGPNSMCICHRLAKRRAEARLAHLDTLNRLSIGIAP